MNTTFCLAGATLTLFAADVTASDPQDPGQPSHEVHSVIALKTDDFELAETDISDLGVGESRTIVTAGGKAIDLLRTADGMEIYVDGALIDLGGGALHQEEQHGFKVVCAEDADCEEMEWLEKSENVHVEVFVDGDGENTHIERTITIECSGGEDCTEHEAMITLSGESLAGHGEEGEMHIVRVHALDGEQANENKHKIIVIDKRVEEN